MNICKKCQSVIPNRVVIDGKERVLNGRHYCLECSPFGQHHGYLLRKKSTEAKLANREGKLVKTCPICKAEFHYPSCTNSVCGTCRKWYLRYRNKTAIYEFLGGRCSKCNCSDFDSLHVHHTNPSEKSFTFSARWTNSMKSLLKEAKKCVLLCANCHSKEHTQHRQDILDYYKWERQESNLYVNEDNSV